MGKQVRQSPNDLRRHLQEQIGFIPRSGAAFDEGDDAEAKRLATTLRVLLHDSRTSRSLLSQLHAKERLRFLDTSHPPVPLGAHRIDVGLAVIRMRDRQTRYVAPLADRTARTPRRFDPWWKEPVLTDQKGIHFSRRDLVLALAHKEGGAHVDPELDAAYAGRARSNSLGWEFSLPDGTMVDAGSPVPANVRQIAWQTQATIERHFRALFAT